MMQGSFGQIIGDEKLGVCFKLILDAFPNAMGGMMTSNIVHSWKLLMEPQNSSHINSGLSVQLSFCI